MEEILDDLIAGRNPKPGPRYALSKLQNSDLVDVPMQLNLISADMLEIIFYFQACFFITALQLCGIFN